MDVVREILQNKVMRIKVYVWHHKAINHAPRLKMELISQEKIMQVLDWAYERSVNGFSGLDSAEELAASYAGKDSSAYDQANS
ncbi:EcsC family protein, partial [Pseudomonas syringae]|nr:EcsC family protein [Pseudomonas syringae]